MSAEQPNQPETTQRSDWPIVPTIEPTQDAAELEAYLSDLVRSLAPIDFDGLPIYVKLQSTLPDTFQYLQHTGGFCAWSLGEILKPSLGSQYKGPGTAMVIADAFYRHSLADLSETEDSNRILQGIMQPYFCGIAIHEAAHILTWEQPFSVELPADTVENNARAIVAELEGEEALQRRKAVPHHLHEWPFIRACAHLAYRAEQGGLRRFRSYLLAAGDSYGLSSFAEYRSRTW